MMSDTAVILAGGLGTRLHPYTVTIPKPLVPIGRYSILEVLIRQLKHFGFNKIIITVNHQAELIESYFRDGTQYSVDITYSRESKRLGTMGPLKGIGGLPPEFLVANGDILTDLDFREFADNHNSSQTLLTVGTYKKTHSVAYGVIESNSEGKIVGFEEKPNLVIDVSMGIYMMNRDILTYFAKDEFYGFDDLLLGLISEKKTVLTYQHNGYWRDLGTPDDYQLANDEFPEMEECLIRG